jgi:hypothetical protein
MEACRLLGREALSCLLLLPLSPSIQAAHFTAASPFASASDSNENDNDYGAVGSAGAHPLLAAGADSNFHPRLAPWVGRPVSLAEIRLLAPKALTPAALDETMLAHAAVPASTSIGASSSLDSTRPGAASPRGVFALLLEDSSGHTVGALLCYCSRPLSPPGLPTAHEESGFEEKTSRVATVEEAAQETGVQYAIPSDALETETETETETEIGTSVTHSLAVWDAPHLSLLCVNLASSLKRLLSAEGFDSRLATAESQLRATRLDVKYARAAEVAARTALAQAQQALEQQGKAAELQVYFIYFIILLPLFFPFVTFIESCSALDSDHLSALKLSTSQRLSTLIHSMLGFDCLHFGLSLYVLTGIDGASRSTATNSSHCSRNRPCPTPRCTCSAGA